MTYRFATETEDYSDFAAGSVLYNLPGATSFPVRLADEIFQRAQLHLPPDEPLRLYDPCCGTAYLLTILGLRHGQHIAALYGSDIDERRLATARANLALLTEAGLRQRQAQLEQHLAAYGKDAHRQALESFQRLQTRLPASPIETLIFAADALKPVTTLHDVDLVITDVPYGDRVTWQNAGESSPIQTLLAALRPALKTRAVLAIVTGKAVKVQHDDYTRVERFQIGKRQITFLKPVQS
jgi:23S rRNA (guanine2535-N1)-methyltransferase